MISAIQNSPTIACNNINVMIWIGTISWQSSFRFRPCTSKSFASGYYWSNIITSPAFWFWTILLHNIIFRGHTCLNCCYKKPPMLIIFYKFQEHRFNVNQTKRMCSSILRTGNVILESLQQVKIFISNLCKYSVAWRKHLNCHKYSFTIS